ncbi:MAG: ribosome small subunit-dependent GTPase A [Lachnospiraceae bacterium]|nr:ribosome small subunit-dependent GTPase A [Lachnospiraceae bacterium]
MTGKIIKGVGGFYYVHLHNNFIYECKAKGVFRNQNIKPMIGDDVDIDIISEKDKTGNIISIHERTNSLIRPTVSNVSQAIIIFALSNPKPNFNLLDRFLIMMSLQHIETIICFNKSDLVSEEKINEIKEIYTSCGYEVLITSTKEADEEKNGIGKLISKLENKTTVLAGPSGVGKSSIVNAVCPDMDAKTGSISDKIKRGKHTTRHTELMCIGEDTYILDTPGFSSLYVEDIEPEDLKYYYNEFEPYESKCRFNGCVHINEPDCAVKEALDKKIISSLRYENYKQLFNELKEKRKW